MPWIQMSEKSGKNILISLGKTQEGSSTQLKTKQTKKIINKAQSVMCELVSWMRLKKVSQVMYTRDIEQYISFQ